MVKFRLSAIERHIRRHHPGCPDYAVTYFAQDIARRDWRDASLGQAVGITMQTFLRHEMTDYDTLLLHGIGRVEARRRVQPHVTSMLNTWSRNRKRPVDPTNSESEDMRSTTIRSKSDDPAASERAQVLTSEEATGQSVDLAADGNPQKRVGMTFNMERDWHTKFKMTAVSRGMDMRQLLIESFAAWEREQK